MYKRQPEDKEKCLDVINKYLSLPEEERLNFRLGKRAGYYSKLADLADNHKHDEIERAMRRLRTQGSNVEETIFKLKDSFI